MFGPGRRVARRTARRTSRRVARRQALFGEALGEEPETQAPAPSQPGPPTGGADVAAELKRLADLHAQGALTDEEFAAAKSKLLGT